MNLRPPGEPGAPSLSYFRISWRAKQDSNSRPPGSLLRVLYQLSYSRLHQRPLLPERELGERPPHLLSWIARRDADGHGLTVGLSDELELHTIAQQAHGHTKEVSFIAGSEGYGVGSGVGWTCLASGVDGLSDSDARRKILADDDIVSGRSLGGLTVNGCSCTQPKPGLWGGQENRKKKVSPSRSGPACPST